MQLKYNIKRDLHIFLLSAVVSVITLFYVNDAHFRAGYPNLGRYWSLHVIFIPVLYGLAGIINWYICRWGGSVEWSVAVGAIFGLFLSLIGRFVLGLPHKIFGYNSKTAWQVHLIAIIMYALIFRLIIATLQDVYINKYRK